jgi:hypothetical protein
MEMLALKLSVKLLSHNFPNPSRAFPWSVDREGAGFKTAMKPRFNLAFYPLKGGRLWIVLSESGATGFVNHYTCLDAEDTAMFHRL